MDNLSQEFTNQWFSQSAKPNWDKIFSKFKPVNLLEIGSFEGASACYLIDKLAGRHPVSLTCIDCWTGGAEHAPGAPFEADMQEVERRFHKNIEFAVRQATHPVQLDVRKGRSDAILCELMAEGRAGSFDFIYVDGSHQARDVLFDALLSFKLLRRGGLMVFDDYLWKGAAADSGNPLKSPKLAIDAFINTYQDCVHVLNLPLYQLYVQKVAGS